MFFGTTNFSVTVVVKELKGDARSVLLRFVSFVNKVLTLFIRETCTTIGSRDNAQYKQM